VPRARQSEARGGEANLLTSEARRAEHAEVLSAH
jgi:hypothetical protein